MPEAALKLEEKPETSTLSLREAPANLEAEQAVLGAILTNNEVLNQVSHLLTPERFYAPVHQEIYSAILKFYDKGQIANPVTLKHHFSGNAGVEDSYLARLVGAATTIIDVSHYCQLILDLATKRELITVGELLVNEAYDPKSDLSGMEQVEQAEQQLFHLATEGDSEGSFRALRFSLDEAVRRAELAIKQKGDVVGISTGLVDLDKLLGGLQNSDLLILAGRPSMGKTALATTIAYHAAHVLADADKEIAARGEKPRSVGFFSLEMSAEQLANRLIATHSGVNSSHILRGKLSDEEFHRVIESQRLLSSLPFFIDDTPALSIAALRTRARRLKRVHNLAALVVDYLQLVRGSAKRSQEGRVQEISEITQGLKAIAKELNIPVIALSQLSRQVEQRPDKRPQLSDLRESGSIEQDADVVMFVYREQYYLEREKPNEEEVEKFERWLAKMEKAHGIAEVIVGKQRNGPIGTVALQFQSDLTRFEDLAHDHYLPE